MSIEKENKWNAIVINALTKANRNILEIREFKSIKATIFNSQSYPTILNYIKAKDWLSIDKFKENSNSNFNEYLDVITFYNQNDEQYVATIYDSNDLWQDPEIIDLIQIK